ncbi:MAG: Rrf2 family transcriptional regulator [Bacteroidia bacterium]|nr:Rrf2 family transcriptional regulator [Bacteroidia bacterium]MBP7260320.1 Rrf2 family transcriptional regulator [Bacteroidia bacterium]MBP9179654.1 Rrf2 family transcriptional regulator [Bacteroidia bacterium]MBP9723952.1 Rrf2 family transcriptional regulator [Bacteroidia bacterium]
MFSKACEYAIRATIYIALQSQESRRVTLKDIAKEIDSPEAFTAKIMQQLVKQGIVDSLKGPTGGFVMEPHNLFTTKLSEVVYAIDGDSVFKGCGLGLKMCNEKKPCPVHEKFISIRQELKHMLETTTIEELALGLKQGMTFLKR